MGFLPLWKCMTRQVPPLYGRFAFPPIEEFVRRTQLVSAAYMGDAEFSAYLTTHDRESFYGLEYGELQNTFVGFRQRIRTMASSCSGPNGRSVNINVRFPENGGEGEGQFVIVTRSPYENDQISRMLQGIWQEKDEIDILKEEAISQLIAELISYKEKEEEEKKIREAEEIAKRIRLANQEKKRAARRTITTIRDKFHFNDKISAEELVEVLQNVSEKYLHGAPFNIRLITTDGQSYSNIGLKGLLRFFKKRRVLVLKLFMDAATPQGELVDIMLAFGSMARHLNAEVEITATRTKEIQAEIRSALEYSRSYVSSGGNSMIHEMFRFEQENFALDRVAKLVSAISTKYLQKESPTAFLSTLRGETYPSLDLRQLRTVFHQHKGQISFLLFGVNHSLTGRTFSLMFQFEAPGHQPYGSLSMMWGDEETHRMIRAVIWEQLQLKPYRPASTDSVDSQREAPKPKEPESMELIPAFSGRNFEIKQRSALVSMPMEAYWSETLWVHIQQTLKTIGWDSVRAEPLYSKEVLEGNWSRLNEVEIVIADLTYKHPDVFYKVGIAHTLGKKVILITQHGRDLPGDFRRFPHIIYDNNIHGLQRLAERIIELVRMG